MEELNNLWEIIKIHEEGFKTNFSYNHNPNVSFDFFEEYLFYQNISNWKELQNIILCHYNSSLEMCSQQQKDICHPFGYMFNLLYSYYIPFMIFVGFLGNFLSCFVFLNTHLKLRSSSYYLAARACADFGFLAALFLVWLNGTLEIPVFNIEGYCQCIVYVSSVCSFLSVWLITAFTVERFIAVQYPLHRPRMCTVARAKAIVFYLVCISLTVNTYVFVTSGIIRLEDGSEMCEMLEGHREVMRVINIIDSVITLIVPLILIVVMNAMIAYNLIKFNKKFKKPGNESGDLNGRQSDTYLEILRSSNNSSRKNTPQETSDHTRSTSVIRLSQFKLSPKHNDINRQKSESRPGKIVKFTKMNSGKKLISTRSQQSITKMLLLTSSVFVLLNLPSYGIRLYVFIFFSIWSKSPPVLLWCMQQLFMILYYTNFSINFILYSMCGITFRRCLWQLLQKKTEKNFEVPVGH